VLAQGLVHFDDDNSGTVQSLRLPGQSELIQAQA
jgi:hypothetical protein